MSSEVTGILLAGGKSSRLGFEKTDVLFRGKTLLENAAEILASVCNQVMIISQNEKLKQLKYGVHPDLIKDKGPAGGILTGLNYSSTTANLVLSCDMPYVNKDFLQLLVDNFCTKDEAVIPTKNSQLQPLAAVYNRKLMTLFSESISKNELKMEIILSKIRFKTIPVEKHYEFNTEKLFLNINTKADLERLQSYES